MANFPVFATVKTAAAFSKNSTARFIPSIQVWQPIPFTPPPHKKRDSHEEPGWYPSSESLVLGGRFRVRKLKSWSLRTLPDQKLRHKSRQYLLESSLLKKVTRPGSRRKNLRQSFLSVSTKGSHTNYDDTHHNIWFVKTMNSLVFALKPTSWSPWKKSASPIARLARQSKAEKIIRVNPARDLFHR